MMRIHMPGYYNSISKGVATVMVSYSSWNGVKMHANHDLVTGFLKNTLQFQVNKLFIKYIIETQNCDICKISNN
jgi:hypothetical protein